ncbi:MAG: ribosome maturation factor RimP [Gammaproteobacteria bacterium]|nr:MAG: ribosome maturation factor RimP [Gammaproteobacteria bacterium]PCH63644.1 MAG: ribosome maturation factor RimP [Gammaproteobacteria bacterium]
MRSAPPRVSECIEPAVTGLGYEFVGAEYLSESGQRVLRVYIDAEKGIDVDDCAKVSHQISGVLDVEDPIREVYTLEVSSPGIDRPLFTPVQFERFVGKKVRLKLALAVLGRKNFTGELVETNETGVVVDVDGEAYDIDWTVINEARLVPQF